MSVSSIGPGSGPSTSGIAQLAIESPAPGVRMIHVQGVLGSGSGARLLRLIDSQLTMTRSGHHRIHAVIVEVSGLTALERGGPQALQHARYACTRNGIHFLVAGHPVGLATAPVSVRAQLGQLRLFPTVEAALAAVT
ncbi:hypothetical protein H7X46_28900 [Pseudonocardia sp. C8]|uniref:hypothetical protein n=1 Tax=Pseudonocardia sp. C8 TaxID=2762759 RepID=UPI001643215D|nr:hypothetical protein [Pseudonocardia sp. C8]MBC3195079.1 hypothetical protein [Pseudonocardia sp. C8]